MEANLAVLSTPGSVLLGKYRVDRVLGEGGMGVVVAATHLYLRERVALKILRQELVADTGTVQRFLREAQAAVRLRSEHVARVIDVGTGPAGVPYIVLEYLDGDDLSRVLAGRGTLPAGELVDYVLQVCEALAEAHAHGIVHRDIKPANAFLTRRPDGSPLVKVLDFGISKLPRVDGTVTRSKAFMGTPSYMSPEQMESARDVDGRTDIWALGVMLYEGICGERPFDAESLSGICMKVAMAAVPPLPASVSPALEQVIRRCLAKAPVDRFQTMAELAAALAPHAADPRAAALIVERSQAMQMAMVVTIEHSPAEGAPAPPTTLGSSCGVIEPQRSRTRFVAAGAICTIAIIAAVLVFGARSGNGDEVQDASVRPAERATRAPAAPALDLERERQPAHPPAAADPAPPALIDNGSGSIPAPTRPAPRREPPVRRIVEAPDRVPPRDQPRSRVAGARAASSSPSPAKSTSAPPSPPPERSLQPRRGRGEPISPDDL